MKSLSPHRSGNVKLSQLAIEFGVVFQGRSIVLRMFAIVLENPHCMLERGLRVAEITCSLASNCKNDVPPAQLTAMQLARIDRGLRDLGRSLETSLVLQHQGIVKSRVWIELSKGRHAQEQ